MSLASLAVFFLSACAGTSSGEGGPTPIEGDQIRVTVVNESDGPVDVYYIWEHRTNRARLGSVSIGRQDEFGVPWVTGRLRIVFESPVITRTITSNALPLSEANRGDELFVRLDWRYRAILEIKE